MNRQKQMIILMLGVGLLLATLAGCVPYAYEDSWGYYDEPDYDYYHHGRWHYRYYPDANIYYEPDRGLWFYPVGGAWRSTNTLPPAYNHKLERFMGLELDTDRPWMYNQEHVRQWPHGWDGRGHQNQWDRGKDQDRRMHRSYRYYPDANVYFDQDKRKWLYQNKGGWQSQDRLPGEYNDRLKGWRGLKMNTDQPYKYNQEHRKWIPPEEEPRRGRSGKGRLD